MGYPKSTEEDEKLALKREEREKEIKRNNRNIAYASNNSNKKIEFVDILYTVNWDKLVFANFSKSLSFRKYYICS